MDNDTAARLADLKVQETDAYHALQAVLTDNKELVDADQHPAQPSPSYAEKLTMRQRVVLAEAKLTKVQEEIRKIDWDMRGIVEGKSITIGIDNVAPADEVTRMWEESFAAAPQSTLTKANGNGGEA